jgi:hypothetical protein
MSAASRTRDGSIGLVARQGRRPVELRGFLVRSNDEIVDVRVLDLSYDGCGVETVTRLNADERVKMSVLGRGAVRASVRWCKGRKAGLLFVPEPASPKQWPRRSMRLPISTPALLRRAGKRAYMTEASDLSPNGCKCEFVDRPAISEAMWIKFDGLETLECKVSWVEDSSAGLQFARPLHPAVFEMLLSRFGSPAPGRLDPSLPGR